MRRTAATPTIARVKAAHALLVRWLALFALLGALAPGCDRVGPAASAPLPTPVATQPGGPVDEADDLPRADPGIPADLPGLARVADPDERADVLAMVQLIRAGGPFAYPDKDGSVFGNYERLLPAQARGYYREYTVKTPGISHRGARRIIAGSAAEMFYTRDHYATFVRLTR